MSATIPAATYRIQFTKDFRFEHARGLLPELQRLGISHIYASPVFAARPGSQHGYDVVDPTRINDELGGRAEFERLVDDLRARDMGIILDIVPNHMAASPHNPWWMDVLENGAASRYASFFGINWSLASEELGAKIVVPTLGAPYGEVLDRGELQLAYEERGFYAAYYAAKFRLGPATYPLILGLRADERPGSHEFQLLLESFERLLPRTAAFWEAVEARTREVDGLKRRLWATYTADAEVRRFVDGNIALVNGSEGDRTSLHRLLEAQAYRLAWWRVANEKVNYRRFFDVNELIGIKVDDAGVFEQTHSLILELIRQGRIDGVRVDHIDGLFDPTEYLHRLSRTATYVTVEKILGDGETLPEDWPVAGTSGYEFLGWVNSVLTSPKGLERLREIWSKFTGLDATRHDVEYGRKKRVTDELFAGEMADLGRALADLAESDLYARDLSPREMARALVETTACLAVYRTYTHTAEVSERDRAYIRDAVREARRRAAEIRPAVFDFLERVLTLRVPQQASNELRRAYGLFVMRWQQISGPIMAKGVEDSTFYVYNPLLSMNEVGSIGRAIEAAEFHGLMQRRQEREPLALSATSTHDTKRSEDARVRLAVLSEIPDEWSRHLTRWSRWMRERRGAIDANEEYFIYQTLLCVWPLEESERGGLRERLHAYMEKASREAREYTSWLEPNAEHEQELKNFVDVLLGDEAFLADFVRLEEKLAFYGAINAVTQTLLKVTCPGVPDFYQGTVGWNLSLVDPDNRRPVAFPKLTDFGAGPVELLHNWKDGRIKVFVTESGLSFRRAHGELFARGEYSPLEVTGPDAEHVVAFARRLGEDWAVVVVPRLAAGMSAAVRAPLGVRAWHDTAVVLPEGAPARWRNVFTGVRVAAEGSLAMSRVLDRFPVALLSARLR